MTRVPTLEVNSIGAPLLWKSATNSLHGVILSSHGVGGSRTNATGLPMNGTESPKTGIMRPMNESYWQTSVTVRLSSVSVSDCSGAMKVRAAERQRTNGTMPRLGG
jgi:hypothetical protein